MFKTCNSIISITFSELLIIQRINKFIFESNANDFGMKFLIQKKLQI